jgi:hypothetical protein
MKNWILALVAFCLFSCSGGSKKEVDRAAADRYITTIIGLSCEKAIVTEDGYLAVGIDADNDSGYDGLASQFLQEAQREGVSGLRGCYIVDTKDATFNSTTVVGKRIGRAFN